MGRVHTFYWTPGTTEVNTCPDSSLTLQIQPFSLAAGLNKSNLREKQNSYRPLLPSRCVLMSPTGKHIKLRVSGRVPVLNDDMVVDVVAPVKKTAVARGSLARDSKSDTSDNDIGVPDLKSNILPAYRIPKKSRIDLTPEQQSKLDSQKSY